MLDSREAKIRCKLCFQEKQIVKQTTWKPLSIALVPSFYTSQKLRVSLDSDTQLPTSPGTFLADKPM